MLFRSMKLVKKEVFDNRIDEEYVIRRRFCKRFEVRLSKSEWDDWRGKAKEDLLCIDDRAAMCCNSEFNLYKLYERVKSKEVTKNEAYKIIVDDAEKRVQGLCHAARHEFDKLYAQQEYDRANGIKADYSSWFESTMF